jgi:DNA-binding MarR family transcriptional regulator
MLWRATLAWQRAVRAALAPHELTHVQFVLLASLWWLASNRGAPPSQRELAEHAGTDPMMTSQVVRKLEARGLVTRAPHPTDARARHLALPPDGERLLAAALHDVEAADEAYFAPLERRGGDFLELLGRLVEAQAAREEG